MIIEHLFQSKSRERILSLLILRQYRGSIRSIAKEADCSPMQARNELINLEKAGIVVYEQIANAKIYSLNRKCSYLDELSALIAKTAGFDIQIKDALNGLGRIEFAFIYGSYAHGNFTGKSDIDLFVIGTPDMKKLNSKIFNLEKEIGLEINVSIYDKQEFDKRKTGGFIRNVLEGKRIMILGDESELS